LSVKVSFSTSFSASSQSGGYKLYHCLPVLLELGLIISCSGYPHPNWKPKLNCPPVLISHGSMDEVVPISASKNIYQKIKSISNNFCFLNEFEGYHQIDLNLIDYVNLKIKELF
jgi:phospholipase/carboxylesterase